MVSITLGKAVSASGVGFVREQDQGQMRGVVNLFTGIQGRTFQRGMARRFSGRIGTGAFTHRAERSSVWVGWGDKRLQHRLGRGHRDAIARKAEQI